MRASHIAWIILIGALAGPGCDGDVDKGTGGSGNDGGTGGQGGGGQGGGGQGGGGQGGGGQGGGGQGGGGQGGAAAEPLYPLALGYSWTYDVQPFGAGDDCGSGAKTSSVVGEISLSGKQGFELDYYCSPGKPISLATEGDLLYYAPSGSDTWTIALDTPVEEGHSWPYFNFTRTWHKAGPVSVPAGNFADCWRVDQEGAGTLASFTYCRGVGLVIGHNGDGVDGSDATLTSKSF